MRILEMTVSVQQDPTRNQGLIQRLGRQIAAILKSDCRYQDETDGGEIETILEPNPTLAKE